MGNLCSNEQKKRANTREFMEVQEQNMLMDNNEVRIMQIEGQKMQKGKNALFDGYLQRKSHFVIPTIDKLRKDKLELKQ